MNAPEPSQPAAASTGKLNFVLVSVFIDVLGIGLIIPVMPALQAIISRGTGPGEQGELMGSLQSISSIGVVVMPLLGAAILGAVSHLPANDWRIGSSFYVSAAMQALAVIAALRYFRKR